MKKVFGADDRRDGASSSGSGTVTLKGPTFWSKDASNLTILASSKSVTLTTVDGAGNLNGTCSIYLYHWTNKNFVQGADLKASTKIAATTAVDFRNIGTWSIVAPCSTLIFGGFNNTGTLAVASTAVSATVYFLKSIGTVSIGAGATLYVMNDSSISGVVSGNGTLDLTDSTGPFSAAVSTTGTLSLVNAIGGWTPIDGGASVAAGTLLTTGIISLGRLNTDTVTVGAAGVLVNAATLTVVGTLAILHPTATPTAQVINQAGGTWAFTQGGTAVTATGSGAVFRNDGLLSADTSAAADPTATVITLDTGLVSTGTISVAGGTTLAIAGGGTLSGTLTGAGILDFGATAPTIAGALTLGGGTLAASTLAITAGTTLSGTGTINAAIANAGTVTATTGTLALTGALSGTGAYTAATGAVLALGADGALPANVTGAGTLAIQGAATLAGKLGIASTRVEPLGTLTGAGTVKGLNNLGTVHATGNLTVAGALAGDGLITADAGATITLAKGGAYDGPISMDGTLAVKGALTLFGDAYLSAHALVLNANLTSAVSLSVAADQSITLAGAKPVTLSTGKYGILTNSGTITSSAATGSIAGSFVNLGQVGITAGTLSFARGVTNTGTILADGGASFAAALTGAGTVQIGDTQTVRALSSVAAGQTFDFGLGDATLALTRAAAFAGTIADFGHGDRIDLIGKTVTSLAYAAGTLTVRGGATTIARLAIAGPAAVTDFTFVSDGQGGTYIGHS